MGHMNSYKEKMSQVKPPSYVKDRVLNEIQNLKDEEAKRTNVQNTQEQAQQNAHHENTPRKGTSRKRKRGVLTLAAAAAAVLIVALAVPLLNTVYNAEHSSNSNGSFVPAENSFFLSAYAASPEVQNPKLDGLISFGNAGGGSVENNSGGEYAQWLFNIKGEGITQVDFEVSTGQIYCFASQAYSGVKFNPMYGSNDPESEAVREALRQKLGGSYSSGGGGYSWFNGDYGPEGFAGFISGCRVLDSNAPISTTLAGGSFDLSEVSFGFYVANEDLVSGSDYEEDFFKTSSDLMATLDGQTMTVQVHFQDGSTETQNYVLRIKKMRVVLPIVTSFNGDGIEITNPYVSEEATEGERFGYVLFGELISETTSSDTTDSSRVIQENETETSLQTAEFYVVSCVKSTGSYNFKLLDPTRESTSQHFDYTHETYFPAPGSSDYWPEEDVTIVDSNGTVVDMDPVMMRDKHIRVTYYEDYSSTFYQGVPFTDIPTILRGVTKIEILGDVPKE